MGRTGNQTLGTNGLLDARPQSNAEERRESRDLSRNWSARFERAKNSREFREGGRQAAIERDPRGPSGGPSIQGATAVCRSLSRTQCAPKTRNKGLRDLGRSRCQERSKEWI